MIRTMMKWLCVLPCLGTLTIAAEGGETVATKAFDETTVSWQDDRERMLRGLQRAEAFRVELLTPDEQSRTQAALIGTALERFRTEFSSPLPDRPTLARFTLTSEAFVGQLRSEVALNAEEAFASFSGRWYGEWNQLLVDHHWHKVQAGSSVIQPEDLTMPTIGGLQYAWIGDGFGWNYLVRPAEATGDIVLGFVYHLKPHEARTIRYKFPLVGYWDGPGRLIWVTPTNIYFEEAFTVSQEQRYAITGFSYQIKEGLLNSDQSGFQAVYTRRPNDRPEWKAFPVTLSVRAD